MSDDAVQRMSNFHRVVVPAVLVRQGEDPAPLLRGVITNPVEIPCRIEAAPDTSQEPASAHARSTSAAGDTEVPGVSGPAGPDRIPGSIAPIGQPRRNARRGQAQFPDPPT